MSLQLVMTLGLDGREGCRLGLSRHDEIGSSTKPAVLQSDMLSGAAPLQRDYSGCAWSCCMIEVFADTTYGLAGSSGSLQQTAGNHW